jgi:hypothetical protein
MNVKNALLWFLFSLYLMFSTAIVYDLLLKPMVLAEEYEYYNGHTYTVDGALNE